ncbi:MAG: nickel pincer cofactor biosynthesis protein LarC [Myxococcales bacterium]
MSILLLEPVGGISGDMFLAATADLGVDLAALETLLHGAGVLGFTLERRRDSRGGIGGTRVDVRIDEHGPHAAGHHGRSWRDIREFLQRPVLAGPIGERASRVFGRLARAEAAIHGVAVDEVHFHEVGALDSIVDVVGAAWALRELGDPAVFTRPPPLGSGLVQSEHGPIPVPAPATLALLRGLPALWEGAGELTTPTGAAILAECARFEPPPAALAVDRVGYGIGHAEWPDRPNLLRASLGELAAEAPPDVGLLEAHLDDASPQLLAPLLSTLLEAGALDAGFSPLLMKKGRPGQRLTVVCRSADRAALTELVFRESTTLGVRWSPVERAELERRVERVETELGPIRVKLGLHGGEVWNVAPELEDCAAIARERRVPLKRVLALASAAAQRFYVRPLPAKP